MYATAAHAILCHTVRQPRPPGQGLSDLPELQRRSARAVVSIASSLARRRLPMPALLSALDPPAPQDPAPDTALVDTAPDTAPAACASAGPPPSPRGPGRTAPPSSFTQLLWGLWDGCEAPARSQWTSIGAMWLGAMLLCPVGLRGLRRAVAAGPGPGPRLCAELCLAAQRATAGPKGGGAEAREAVAALGVWDALQRSTGARSAATTEAEAAAEGVAAQVLLGPVRVPKRWDAGGGLLVLFSVVSLTLRTAGGAAGDAGGCAGVPKGVRNAEFLRQLLRWIVAAKKVLEDRKEAKAQGKGTGEQTPAEAILRWASLHLCVRTRVRV